MRGRYSDAIDHLIIGVRDLDAARDGYARLGFNTTPRGRHVGWGTANYCIMFENDYLELLGIVDPTAFTNGLDRLLEERQGLQGIVFKTDDADATGAAWQEAGLRPDGPKDLGRLLEHGGPDGQMLRFANVYPAADRTAGVSFFACRHLTPELLRRPGWTAHPNGAVAIRSVTWLVPDAVPVVEVMQRIVGTSAVTWTDDVAAVHLGRCSLLFAQAKDIGMLRPHLAMLEAPNGPVPVAMSVAVDDLDRAGRFLETQNVACSLDPSGAITIGPEQAFGVELEFVAA